MVYFSGRTKLKGGSVLVSLLIALLFVFVFNYSSLGGVLLHVEVRACKNNFGGCLNPLEDAEVYINGKFVGITDHVGRLWQDNLRAGRYKVQVQKNGWKAQAKQFRATPNEFEKVTFTLRRPKSTSRRDSKPPSTENRFEDRSNTDSRDSYGSVTRESSSSGGGSTSSKNLSWLFLKFIFIIIGILIAVWIVVSIIRGNGIQEILGRGNHRRRRNRFIDEIERDLRDLMGDDS